MRIFILFVIMSLFALSIHSQEDHLKFRFNNVKFDRSQALMTADIEVWTIESSLSLYAVNARLFYEADFLQFQSFSNFREGYDFVSGSPTPVIGGEKSAVKMFNTEGIAGYINAGIELKEPSRIKEISDKTWTKLVQINFELNSKALSMKQFCPVLIWDRTGADEKKKSFLLGSVGAVASVLTKGANNALECSRGKCSFENMNWELKSEEAPFGEPFSSECLNNILEISKSLVVDGYNLLQNSPNPFAKETMINFQNPYDEEIHLKIYDLKGQLMMEMAENFTKGKNRFEVDASALPNGTYLYHIVSEKFTSDYKKMIKIGN